MNYSEYLVKEKKINRAVEINVQAKYWFTAAKLAMKVMVGFHLNFDSNVIFLYF